MSTPTTRVTDAPMTFRAQLAALWRYKHLIAMGVAVGILGALALAFLPASKYTAPTDVLVRITSDTPFQSGDVTKQISMQTEIEVAESQRVAGVVAKDLADGSTAADLVKNLRVTNPPDTTVLRFGYTDPDPAAAAKLSNAFAQAYLEDREARTQRTVDDQIKVLNEELATLEARLKEIDKEIARGSSPALEAQRNLVAEEVLDINSRVINAKTIDTTPGDVVRAASEPRVPDGAGLPVMIVLGALFGLVMGVTLAWVVGWLRRGESNIDPLTLHTGVEVLTTLRRLDLRPGGDDGMPLRASEPASTLALTLAYGRELEQVRSLLVVETRATEGARSVAVDLSLALAEMGRNVALVEGDFRTPMLAAALPLVPNPDVAARVNLFEKSGSRSAPSWPDASPLEVRVAGPGRIHLYPGAPEERPLEVLNRPAVQTFLANVRDKYDFVVVVSPGLLTYVDGLELMHRLDGSLLVSDARDWSAPDLESATAYARRVGGRLIGAVRLVGSARIVA